MASSSSSSSSLAELSHSISSTPSLQSKPPPPQRGRPKGSTSSSVSASAVKFAAPVSTPTPKPPKPQPAKTKLHEAQDEEARRQEYLGKLEDYLEKPRMRMIIGENICEELEDLLRGNQKLMSVEVLQKMHERILRRLRSKCKQVVIDRMFIEGLKGGEFAMVNFLHWDYMIGFSKEAIRNREEFEPELTELAIELSEGWVPGPKVRLAMKIWGFVQEYQRLHHGKVHQQPDDDLGRIPSPPPAPISSDDDDDDDAVLLPHPIFPQEKRSGEKNEL